MRTMGWSSNAHMAGDRVNETISEITVRAGDGEGGTGDRTGPEISVMKAAGTNTAHSTSAIATSAPPTSSMLFTAASWGDSPAAMLRSTFSTTTIASSTTMPIASTRPNSDRLLSVNPERSH